VPPAATARASVELAAAAVLLSACAPPRAEVDAGCTECPEILSVDPPDGSVDVPTNPVIRFETDEHLRDETVIGSNFKLYSGPLSMWLMAFYDPVRRTTTVWPSSHLRVDADWVLEAAEGITDRDGHPLRAGPITTFTSGEDEDTDLAPFPELRYSPDIAPIFEASCASCHGGAEPLAGLSLDSADGITATALGVASDGMPSMKRISAARPGGSYLVYKILGDAIISGLPMPCSFDGAAAAPLSPAQMQEISDWIAGGALMEP
jgi:hypothetical protein